MCGIMHYILGVTIQVSFRLEGEIFRVMQISPRSTRRNDNYLDSYFWEFTAISILK